ncbi:hypothetical protein [Providencia sp. PROV120]|uniref:hypothetical protein n=1 Tax=Providencia sp. PROV120 TaxID=2949831 RepID=UPI00234B71B6|nr:hypothetical protein [Providencia sp. PROV120]
MSHIITIEDINKLKKKAKSFKKNQIHRESSHSQLLNLAAREEFGMDYHNVLKDFNNQFEGKNGNISNCLLCDMLYVPSDSMDKRNHDDEHKKRVAFIMDLNFIPMNLSDREAIKQYGYKLIYENINVNNVYLGALAVFVGHFDRSLWNAFNKGSWKKHPSFKEYVAMMLNDTHLKPTLPTSVMERLIKNFGKIESHVIDSYWDASIQGNQYSPYDKGNVRSNTISQLKDIK